MIVELKTGVPINDKTKYTHNILVVYLDEDIYNDPEYKKDASKYRELKDLCWVKILENLSKLPLSHEYFIAAGAIHFDITNVPKAKNSGKSNIDDINDMFRTMVKRAEILMHEYWGLKGVICKVVSDNEEINRKLYT